MKYLLVLCVSLFLVGCNNHRAKVQDNNEPSDIEKAQQEVVCRNHFGIYEYGSNNYLICNDGFKMLTKDSNMVSGPEVYDELIKLQNKKNVR